MGERFPTRNGIAIPLPEIDLPKSRLNPEVEKNYNTHHDEWTRKKMASHAISLCLRNLERHQWLMLKDVHCWVHNRFDPPQTPTLRQAADEVMEAHENGENVRVYDMEQKKYVEYPIPRSVIAKIGAEYSTL